MTFRLTTCIIFTLLCITPPASAQTLEFQKVFEQHGVVMLVIDPNTGTIVDANPAAAQFYGHERDDLKTMTIQQINTLSAAQVAEERTLAQNEGRNYFIFRHRLADGEIRTVEVHSNPFTIAGRPLLLSLIHDITLGRNLEQGMWNYQQRLEELVEARTAELEARHLQITLIMTGSLFIVSITAIMLFRNRAKLQRFELDLRQQKALLKSLLDSTPDFIFYKNLEGVYLGCNRHFAELVNKKEQDIIGKADYDLFDRETANFFREQDRLMRKQGQTRRNDEWVTWPDGQKVLLDTLKTPYRGPDDKIVGLLGISRDITERKRAEEALKKSERFLNSTLDSLTAHITVLDDQGGIILTNKAYRDFATQNGIEPHTVSEGANYLTVCDIASGEYSAEATHFAEGIRDVLSGKCRSFKLEYPCHSPDEERWFIGHVTLFEGEGSRQVIVAHEIITERKQAEEAIKTAHKQLQTKNSLLDSLSKTDQLTGIANRRRTQQVIEQEIDRFNRYKKPFCVFLFDIDHFKVINDNHGHEVGDQVLVELVGLVQSVIRRTDTLGRWGGEEFILVCPETSLTTAQAIAKKICITVREHEFTQGLSITLSIGVSEIQIGATLKEILVEVDRKMYLAKQKGRDQVEA